MKQTMKRASKTILIGILAIMLVFGMAVVGCGKDSTDDGPSEIGVNWDPINGNPFGSSWVTEITYGGGKFVAAGHSGKLAYSTDGETWTPVADSKLDPTGNGSYGLAYGNSKFVAGDPKGKIAYSADGVTWTAATNTPFGAGGDAASNIAFGNGKFVAVTSTGNKSAYSTDGATWTSVTFSFSEIRDIAFGNGTFVIVNASGKIAYSTNDGVTWTQAADSTFGTSQINGVAYGGDKFVATGQYGKIAYSADGVTWTAVQNIYQAESVNTEHEYIKVTYGDGMFLAAGYPNLITTFSKDGINWKWNGRGSMRSPPLCIAYGNGVFVVGAENGLMRWGKVGKPR